MEGYQGAGDGEGSVQSLGSHEEKLGRSGGDGHHTNHHGLSMGGGEPQNCTEEITCFSIFDIMYICLS